MLAVVDVACVWLDPNRAQDLSLPVYTSELAAGMDIGAAVEEPVVLAPGEIVLLPTNLAVAIPQGYEIQVRPRSGLAIKHGITVVNAPGTIDADYRGEIKIGLINLSKQEFTIHRGDRIAQLILAPVVQGQLRLCEALPETKRGAGGFGHSGINQVK